MSRAAHALWAEMRAYTRKDSREKQGTQRVTDARHGDSDSGAGCGVADAGRSGWERRLVLEVVVGQGGVAFVGYVAVLY
jgi:hypothetical protein